MRAVQVPELCVDGCNECVNVCFFGAMKKVGKKNVIIDVNQCEGPCAEVYGANMSCRPCKSACDSVTSDHIANGKRGPGLSSINVAHGGI